MPLDVVQLQILARLGEGRTLTAIAHELSVHQSAVSRALHAAEQQVGLQLTFQQGRRLRLTPAGHEVALAAQSAAAQLADVDFLVERLKSGRTGSLHVLAVSTPANYLLPEPLAAFMEQFPDIHVVLHRAISHLWDMFATGDYDVAVLPSNSVPADWPHEPLYEDRLALFVGPRSALFGGQRAQWKDICSETFIGQFATFDSNDFWEGIFSQGFGNLRHAELMAPEGVKRLVEASTSIGFALRAAVWREVRDGRLWLLDIEEELAPSVPFSVVRRPHRRPLPIVDQFCRLLRAYLPGMGFPPSGSEPLPGFVFARA